MTPAALIGIVEACIVLAALVLAGQWTQQPSGNYEPWIAVLTLVLAVFEVLRRYLRIRRLRVFLSVGATYTDEQELFVSEFEKLMESIGCERLVVGRDSYTALQPIRQVRNLMKRADAVMVIAFTRTVIKKAVDKPAAKAPAQVKTIANIRMPTIWNQIEAGIAYGLGKPLFVFLEEGLKQEAMLKDRHEFRVQTGPMEVATLQTNEFTGTLKDFVRIARRRAIWRIGL